MQLRRLVGIGRLASDERGVAAVEFALILPFLLLLFLGTIEASSLITVDRRVNVISGTVGDLVARTDPTVPLTVTWFVRRLPQGVTATAGNQQLFDFVAALVQ